MKTTHTPGPWNFHPQGDANEYCLLVDKKRWVVAFRINGEFGREEELANARLIAAAPELLEACCIALANLKPLYPPEHIVIRNLTAAISKSEGQS